MSEPGSETHESLRLPPHRRRIAAFLIDSTLPLVVLVATGSMGLLAGVGAESFIAIFLLVVLVAGATNGFITWLSGGWTWGRAWAGIQVRHAGAISVDPAARDLPKLLLRNTVGYVGIDVLLLGCLNALRDPRRRPLHDWVLGYDVVALAESTTPKERLCSFAADLKAGQSLVREQWGLVGVVLGVYSGVVTQATSWVTAGLQALGVGAPSGGAVSTPSLAAVPIAAPTTVGAATVGVGGTALAGAAIVGAGAVIAPSAVAYPDELTLVPAVQYEPSAYPMGLPPDLHLEFDVGAPVAPRDLPVDAVTAASFASVVLTIANGPYEGATFRFDDVIMPTEIQPAPDHGTDVVNWSDLTIVAEDDGAFIPRGMAVADIRHVAEVTYAGYRVARPGGTMSLSFPYLGDGTGGLAGVGVTLEWRQDLECVVVDENPTVDFDPFADCDDKGGSMFWVWGPNNAGWQ